jgi:hypothetical protein
VGVEIRTKAVEDARSISSAANALLKAIHDGDDARDVALDRLELRAKLADDGQIQGFDAAAEDITDEDLLASVSTQLGIGMTLLAAESALTEPGAADALASASTSLADSADYVESDAAHRASIQGFEVSPGGVPLGLYSAAYAALDEMSDAAAHVVTALLDKALKPVVNQIPAQISATWHELNLNVTGRLARWGLRAVRRGLDLLLTLIDLPTVRAMRSTIDQVLSRLGHGEDAQVLAGWVIGAESVRAEFSGTADTPPQLGRATELAQLADRFSRLCGLLSRIAAIIAGLTAGLGIVHMVLPHALAITTVGLAIVLGIVIAYGRSYTGTSELPIGVRGVRLIVGEADAGN